MEGERGVVPITVRRVLEMVVSFALHMVAVGVVSMKEGVVKVLKVRHTFVLHTEAASDAVGLEGVPRKTKETVFAKPMVAGSDANSQSVLKAPKQVTIIVAHTY
mmetsp:Transcript_13107/g.20803  ORF Transcript_13107/g.20803 Transcript_13107/m.20803 type:complete len:104 (+) Transcript_13107:543-854(+)